MGLRAYDFAYYGDIIAHGGTPSGIDNNIVTFGGYVKYRQSEGVSLLAIDFQIPLLIVDSGDKVKTGELVSYVRSQKEKNPDFVNFVLNNLNNISERALKVLNSQEFSNLGLLMTEYYEELKKLNISTSKLDKIVEIALKNKALGVKPTGAWGGGCCLALMKNQRDLLELKEVFTQNNFKSFQAKIGVEGVKCI
jgi:mevalonate kinase